MSDECQFEYDDQMLTVQGVKFDNNQEYQTVKISVINSYVEGWHPTRQDVEEFKRFLHPKNEEN